jgi:hypothetical protein
VLCLVLLAQLSAPPTPVSGQRSLADVARERALKRAGEPRPTAIVFELPTSPMRVYVARPVRTPLGPDYDQPNPPTTNGAALSATNAAKDTPTPESTPIAVETSAADRVANMAAPAAAAANAVFMVGLVLFFLMWAFSPWIGLRIGRTKGYADWAGALAGLFLGPFVIFMGLVSRSSKKCPFCLSNIPIKATVCARCQKEQPK